MVKIGGIGNCFFEKTLVSECIYDEPSEKLPLALDNHQVWISYLL
jgi:hypothetical protein